MSRVIDFKQARNRKESLKLDDLNSLMRQAQLIAGEDIETIQDGFSIVKDGQLQRVFQARMSQEILARKLIAGDIFLCCIYVSNLLAETAGNIPESWWAIDYLNVDDRIILKRGGDICFLICGVFPKRGNYRLMDISYYKSMGIAFYHRLYILTRKEIGYYMSCRFSDMVKLVSSCITNSQKE